MNTPTKILVTYATCTGSTIRVAETIGSTLSQKGALVDVMPMNKVKDLAVYEAVVAGSAIQDNKWLPEAVFFVQEHRAELLKNHSRPFWFA
jgi:menaquinone-dependent protoporphyrinogen oxidase